MHVHVYSVCVHVNKIHELEKVHSIIDEMHKTFRSEGLHLLK